MIGSLPHQDPAQAVALVRRYLPQLPAWPQLPRRSPLENMYAQFAPGFPGITTEGERIFVRRGPEMEAALERLYNAYLENRAADWDVDGEHAAGLQAFLDAGWNEAWALKGQVTGPISLGLTITDEARRPILYDEVLADALAKHLRLKAAWQNRALAQRHQTAIIFVDEPYLSAFGSAFVSLSREQVLGLLGEVFDGISGYSGVHCCGNTDWSVLLATSVDILNLDAYNYAEAITLYPAEVEAFLRRGGAIAWGLAPNEEEPLQKETAASLLDRWEAAAAALSRKGVDSHLLRERWLLTPSCGLAGLSKAAAEQALELTAQTAAALRKRYLKA